MNPSTLNQALVKVGVYPMEAHCRFDNLDADSSVRAEALRQARAFAAAPRGLLLLLGPCGVGKTHLAIALLAAGLPGYRAACCPKAGGCPHRGDGLHDCHRYREARCPEHDHGALFVRHRDFLEQCLAASRQAPFGQRPPADPLPRLSAVPLLCYDDLAAPQSDRQAGLLLDLFDHRFGHGRPTVITANLVQEELPKAIGSRLHDRFTQEAFAVLTLDGPSYRAKRKTEYLSRLPGEG